MSINAILIDDEKNNIANLQALLKTWCPLVNVVATAMNADEGKVNILKYQPDVVFLDVQMPLKNGFAVLKDLVSYDFEVIFVTAFEQYAIQAMRFAAIDYLLKPIDPEELRIAVDRAIKKCEQKLQNNRLENLVDLLKSHQNKAEHRLALTTLKETRFIRTNDIVRCESCNNYTTFFLLNGEQFVVSKPIYEYDEILKEYGFIRCHQSHLVNKRYIKSWRKEYGDFLLLTTGSEIPVSRGKKDEVRKQLED